MIFLASVQLSLSVMGLRPKSEGLSFMVVDAATETGRVAPIGGGESDDLEEERAVEEPSQVESAVEERRADDEEDRWVRMYPLEVGPPLMVLWERGEKTLVLFAPPIEKKRGGSTPSGSGQADKGRGARVVTLMGREGVTC